MLSPLSKLETVWRVGSREDKGFCTRKILFPTNELQRVFTRDFFRPVTGVIDKIFIKEERTSFRGDD